MEEDKETKTQAKEEVQKTSEEFSKKTVKEETPKEGKGEEEEKEVAPKVKKQEDRQLFWAVLIIIIFFAAFLGPYYYIQSQKTFEYNNLTYNIQEHGELKLYHNQFAKNYNKQNYGDHNVFLRNDPRTNKIEINDAPIQLQSTVMIAQSPEVLACDKSILATDALFQITNAFPFIKAKIIAITNETFADEHKKPYATCEDKPQDVSIFQVELGETSSVVKDPENDCYKITIDSCENNLLTVERFVIDIIEQLNG
ncbi:MAG: hypothetical protein ACI83O_000823 [Patescibacteria group bacterium]|jgi:hypothetical protein